MMPVKEIDRQTFHSNNNNKIVVRYYAEADISLQVVGEEVSVVIINKGNPSFHDSLYGREIVIDGWLAKEICQRMTLLHKQLKKPVVSMRDD